MHHLIQFIAVQLIQSSAVSGCQNLSCAMARVRIAPHTPSQKHKALQIKFCFYLETWPLLQMLCFAFAKICIWSEVLHSQLSRSQQMYMTHTDTGQEAHLHGLGSLQRANEGAHWPGVLMRGAGSASTSFTHMICRHSTHVSKHGHDNAIHLP